jgi:YggT family protein
MDDVRLLLSTSVFGGILGTVAWIFLIILIARFVFEYVFLFARDYTPAGVVLVLVEVIYTVTDPPLKLLRRFIPPLRLGQVSLDLSMLALFFLTYIVIYIVAPKL